MSVWCSATGWYGSFQYTTGSGFSVHQEMEHLIRTGVSIKAVLQTANNNPTRNLGSDNLLGSVTTGKEADLIYDLNGELVKKLTLGTAEAGILYEYEMNASEMTSGMFITRLITPSRIYNLRIIKTH